MPLKPNRSRETLLFVAVIIFLSLASFVRVWAINGTMWDDNAWLMSLYATHGLEGFLNTSFVEMRRVPLGVFLYPLFWLHKNTDLYFMVWHSLNTVTQIGAPLILYATCSRLFGNKLLSFFIAASLAVFYLDQTLPYASAINYRLGLLLGISSFYFTVRSLQSDRPVLLSGISLFLAVVAYTVFIEAVVALEPGRFAVILFLLHQKNEKKRWELFRSALLKWLPYVAACVPFAIYKLMYRSFGIYAGVYEPDFLFLLDGSRIMDLLAFILLFQWVIFSEHIMTASWWSVVLSVASIMVLMLLLSPAGKIKNRSSVLAAGLIKLPFRQVDRSLARHALYIGIILLVFPLAFFQFFRRPVTWGINSSHGTIAQFGYAVVIGSVLFMLFNQAAKKSVWRLRIFCAGTALFLSLSIFFNNLNLDLYQDFHQRQSRFWKSFVARFPSLPADATFLFDVKDGSLYNPMYYYYYECMINLLYAENALPEQFRRYRVTTFYELHWQNGIKNDAQLRDLTFTRESLWGKDRVDPGKFIWVYYDNDQLLINDEIVKRYPDSPYRLHLSKPFPDLPLQPRVYPFRYKVLGRSG